MASLFTNPDGSIVLQADGSLMYDEKCCCGPTPTTDCTHCDAGTAPTHLSVEFTADLNNSGPGTGCGGGGCTNWIAKFQCNRMTSADVTTLWADFPTTFFGYAGSGRDTNCWYIYPGSLPCAADFLAMEIYDTATVSDKVFVVIGWADGTFVRLQITWSTTITNCLNAFRAPGAPNNIGISEAVPPVCDFLKLAIPGNWPNVVVTAS